MTARRDHCLVDGALHVLLLGQINRQYTTDIVVLERGCRKPFYRLTVPDDTLRRNLGSRSHPQCYGLEAHVDRYPLDFTQQETHIHRVNAPGQNRRRINKSKATALYSRPIVHSRRAPNRTSIAACSCSRFCQAEQPAVRCPCLMEHTRSLHYCSCSSSTSVSSWPPS